MDCLNSLSSQFKSLLIETELSDLEIRTACGAQIRVHRLILSARSSVFQTMLRNDMVERNTGVIEIDDFDLHIVKNMVDYVYSGKIDAHLSEDDLKALLRIGDKYEIQSLVVLCRKKLVESISANNAVDLGVYASTFSDVELLQSCCEFLSEDLEALGENWEDHLESYPEFLMMLLRCMKQNHRTFYISRFSSTANNCSWLLDGSRKDSISFETRHRSRLCEIGLFGSMIKESIPVNLTVKKVSSIVFSEELVYESSGKNEPIKVKLPVQIPIDPETDYTVTALIRPASGSTFHGIRGKEVVEGKYGSVNAFKVCFVDIDDESSRSYTDVYVGQIPLLVFKV